MDHSQPTAFWQIRERERYFAGEKVLAKYGPTFSIAIVLEVMGQGNN